MGIQILRFDDSEVLHDIDSVGKKTSFSALRLSENSSFTQVNCGFSDFASLENEVFLSNTRLFVQSLDNVLVAIEGYINKFEETHP